MAKIVDGDYPSPMVSVGFRAPGFCVSIALCALLYMTALVGIQFYLRFKKVASREFVECQKKAWIVILNFISIYLFNRANVATTIIAWFLAFAHIGALVLCVMPADKKEKFHGKLLALGLVLSLLNWLIHWLTRTFTSGKTMINKGLTAQGYSTNLK